MAGSSRWGKAEITKLKSSPPGIFQDFYIPVIQDQLWNNSANEDFSAIVDPTVSTRLTHIPREQKRDSSIIHVIDEQNSSGGIHGWMV